MTYCAVGVILLTIGIDIGTTSVKAGVFDDDGAVVARTRIPHQLLVPAADRLEHDAARAWRQGPRRALRALGPVVKEAAGVAVSSMVPCLTAVDRRGRPLTPGLLYGDARGRLGPVPTDAGSPGEMVEFLRWTAKVCPGAFGYWPALAVANRALGAQPAVDHGIAFSSVPLFGANGWDADVAAGCGADTGQLPPILDICTPVGRVDGQDGAPMVATGSVDVYCEQMTAGTERVGDVHVQCGTTLLVWSVIKEWRDTPGLWTIPHPDESLLLSGGASNAGGLFLDWVGRLLGQKRGSSTLSTPDTLDPNRVPVWAPYLRGERTPYHDPNRRATLAGLDLTHGADAVRRAAWEASAFVARNHIERAGVTPTRIIATGGGTRVTGWVQALADVVGVPVHLAAVPEGAAQGAAFLARVGVGAESHPRESGRWARTGSVVEPDPGWAGPTESRYRIFLEMSEPG